MSDNYIVHNEELEEIEAQLKELSKTYQDKYEESGKYLKNTPKVLLWFFYCPIILLLVLKTQFHLFSYDVFIIVFLILLQRLQRSHQSALLKFVLKFQFS